MVEHSLWERVAVGSNPIIPTSTKNYSTMEIYSVQYWQENWDELLSRVEKGEHIGVTNGKDTAIMLPADDELIRMYRDHEEGS